MNKMSHLIISVSAALEKAGLEMITAENDTDKALNNDRHVDDLPETGDTKKAPL